MAITTHTEDLIGGLARQAGSSSVANPRVFRTILIVAALCSLGISVALVLALVGLRPHFAAADHRAALVYKIVSMLMLSLGGLALASRAALPGSGRLALAPLLPAALVLAYRAATDHSGLPVMGDPDFSSYGCVLIILCVSLLPLAILLCVLRIGAPTRPVVTGAIAGLLSGALGATAYALGCTNDGGLFVAIWYPLAILVMAALGAAIGRRALAW
jgi:hypothetical protein